MKKIILPVLIAVLSAMPSTLFSQDNEKLIKDYISQNKLREYKKSDLTNFIVDNVDVSQSMNGTVVKFQQTYNDVLVNNAVGTVLIKDNKIVYYTDSFIKDYMSSSPKYATLDIKSALHKIADDLGKEEISQLPIMKFFEKGADKMVAAKQRLVYINDGNGDLKLAYEFLLHEPQTPNHWNYFVDANTGVILSKLNLNLSCNFKDDAYSRDSEGIAASSLPLEKEYYPIVNNSNLLFLTPDNASYNVFALPVESPSFGSRSIVSNPWVPSSSPEGWHSNGATHYTITRGNNVYAYDDKDDNEATFGASPDGGAARNFNFTYNSASTAFSNLSAATTNLFYISNMVHDIFYKFGFTESAKNFQSNNFGNGGLDDDEVFAQSQDGGGYNNANFAPYPDNYNPIMQMYLWVASNKIVFYNAPSDSTSRVVVGGTADFGPAINDIGVTGDVKLSSVIDGCTALPAGELAGKIGLIQRGTCSFTVKVKNAQNAGAVGAIIYNDTANGSSLINMGGTDTTITIPSVLVTNVEGEYMKTKLAANTTVNVDLRVDAKYDGSFDNGIVTHEYGHGISNRLTGSGSGCLSTSSDVEQMGEGWSDFFALMLTNKAGDNASVPRGMGTYPIGQATTGGGIRPAKYSPDFAINDYTYGDTNGMAFSNGGINVHSIGFVWATMLWDLHWQYVAKYGYSSNVMTNTTNGSSRVLQLVVDALKLQVCNPTFVDGRNAILQADLATTGGADKCMIWRTFAKRGLGVLAAAGSKTNINDQTEDFTVPAECVLATDEVKSVKTNTISIYPNPAKNEFFINFPSNTLGKVSVEIYDMSGKLVSTEDKISPEAKKSISTDKLINGTYMVKVKGIGIDAVSKVIVKK